MLRDSDNVVDANQMEYSDLRNSANRNAFYCDWMVRNGKGHMDPKYEHSFIPSEDNPIGSGTSRGEFRIKKIWYHYEEGKDPPDTHIPWIAAMVRDFNAAIARQKKKRAQIVAPACVSVA